MRLRPATLVCSLAATLALGLGVTACGGGSDAPTTTTTTASTIPVPSGLRSIAPDVVDELHDIGRRTIPVQATCKDIDTDACRKLRPKIEAIAADAIALSDRIDEAAGSDKLPPDLKATLTAGQELYCATVEGDLCPNDSKTILATIANMVGTVDAWKAIS